MGMTFRLRSLHHNTVTIAFLPRVHRFFVLSHLRFRVSRPLFILPVARTKKKNSTTTSTSMSHFPCGFPPRCPMCSTKLPDWECSYCPSHRLKIKMQKTQLDVQETKILKLRDLQLENERLRRGHQRLHQKHEELRVVYYNQIGLISLLKKSAIKNIGKKLISFLSQQSKD